MGFLPPRPSSPGPVDCLYPSSPRGGADARLPAETLACWVLDGIHEGVHEWVELPGNRPLEDHPAEAHGSEGSLGNQVSRWGLIDTGDGRALVRAMRASSMMHDWVLCPLGWCYTAGLIAHFHPAQSVSSSATLCDPSRRVVGHVVGLFLVNTDHPARDTLLLIARERALWNWKASATGSV